MQRGVETANGGNFRQPLHQPGNLICVPFTHSFIHPSIHSSYTWPPTRLPAFPRHGTQRGPCLHGASRLTGKQISKPTCATKLHRMSVYRSLFTPYFFLIKEWISLPKKAQAIKLCILTPKENWNQKEKEDSVYWIAKHLTHILSLRLFHKLEERLLYPFYS